ncbi:uncharacterized protein DDB_G0283697-like isoform X1 [Saccostrea echinata]|uniref:uncharacterized protein DDB_G0283697-like isoform X1 n=1 Tax=Saccostrea echinata TaxID=191078 RepID=UPI002A7EF554|nr:uncharacterized protein DDB_G0283697-like isoform X1 [Saccostrea echinata]
MKVKKMLFVCLLVNTMCVMIGAFEFTVDFENSADCGRTITVSDLDVFTLKANPNPTTSGGAASCVVKFNSASQFVVNVQHIDVTDCTARLYFYDNDNTQKFPSQTLSCIPTTGAGQSFRTRTGNLIVRLDKGSGSTKAYSFNLVLTTTKGVVSNNVADTGGGGVGTGAIIGIAVGVVAFLIIIIAVVCFFVCRQMAQQKEEKMRQLQPSVFTTASSRQATAPSAPHLSTSGSQHGTRQGSIRTSQRTKRSQAFENKAFSDTSNVSADFVGSKASYAIISDGSVDGKSSIRMQNLQRSGRTGSARRDRSVPDKGLSDDARSSVKFDLRSDSELGRISRPLQGDSAKNKIGKNTTPKEFIRTANGKENDSTKTVDRKSEKTTEKPKKSTTEGKDYFREYTNKGYDEDVGRSGSVRKSKYKESSSSSHNSSNMHEHRERKNDVYRSRSKSESRHERERYRESESDDFYMEQRHQDLSHRRNSLDRSHRRSDSRTRRRDDFYSDRESDSDDFYRERNRRSKSADRRGNQREPVRRSNSRSRSRSDYYDDYRSDDSFIRSTRHRDYRDGYKSDNRYDNRSSYRRDKRDGYRSDNRYDYRDEYRRDNRYDHRDRLDSFKDRERRNQRASYDHSNGHRSRATSVGSAYSKQRSSRYVRY